MPTRYDIDRTALGELLPGQPGYQADVIDRDGQPVPPNTGGLLILRGPWPQMMRTIWNDPARYAEYWTTIPGVYVPSLYDVTYEGPVVTSITMPPAVGRTTV